MTKTYEQLSDSEKEQAHEYAVNQLLTDIVEGSIRFNDQLNGDDLQARIDAAGEKANEMQTPWFAAEYVYEAAKDDIDGMALVDAEDAIYLEPGENAIRLPISDGKP